MPVKVVLSITEGQDGSSETYYNNAANIDAFAGTDPVISDETLGLGKLMRARTQLMPSNASIVRARVSTTGARNDFRVYTSTGAFKDGTFTTATNSAEFFASLLIQMEAGTARRRRLYLSALPEQIVKGPQTYTPTAAWNIAFGNFQDLMKAGSYVTQGRPIVQINDLKTVLTFNVRPDGKTAIISPDPRPNTNPEVWYVLIRGMKNPRGWNGVHRAQLGAEAGTLLIGPTKKSLPSLPTYVIDPGATIVTYTTTPAIIDRTIPIRIVKKSRGRPFGEPRGRR